METERPRMTVDSLKDCNKKYLAQMAKDQGIVGWHAMRKDQLIRALSVPPSASKKSSSKAAGRYAPTGDGSPTSASSRRPPPPAAPARPLTVVPPRALDHACIKD